MKKTVLTLLLSLSLALGLCAFTACSQNDDDDDDTGSTYTSIVNKFESFSSEDEVYGFTAASAATVLSAMGESAETYAASLSSRGALDAAPCPSGGHTADDVDHIVDDDDDEDYIVDDDDEDDPTEQTTDYVKIERKTVLTGVIVIDGTDYPVSGESKYESETGDESETEYEQELLVTTGADSYMKIKLETETEDGDGETESETKYSYAFYESGSLTAKNTFKYETEDDETRLKLTSYDAETEETTVFYYEIEEEDGVQSIKIRIGTSDATESLTVTIAEDGSYVYTANSGTKYYKDR